MSVYDSFRQSQTPFISQYVGSIVPELQDFSKVMGAKYDQAADTDDQLTEALNNLHHLGFASDTQYANELKQQYYGRLMDRSERGDYENMGRRTRRDAATFSQAYQPLMQRQKDFVNAAQQIQYDTGIVDPATKQALIGKLQHINEPQVDPTTGDYIRDPQTGRIQLGGISPLTYAKDVDRNKIVMDALAKKEADIRSSGFATVNGFRVQTVEKLRDPAVMAQLAKEIQASDPGIRAMDARDADLATYKMTDSDISDALNKVDVTPYQQYKRQGLNDHQIGVMAKANHTSVGAMKQSIVQQQLQSLTSSGMTPEAAKRALYQNYIIAQKQDPTNRAMGDLFGFKQVTHEEHDDPYSLEKFKKTLVDADNTVQLLQGPPIDAKQVTDAKDITGDYTSKHAGLMDAQKKLQGTIIAIMNKSGMGTGSTTSDLAKASDYLNNPDKLNELAKRIDGSNPGLADQLRTMVSKYNEASSVIRQSSQSVKGLEQASKVDLQGMYNQYLKDIDKQANPQYSHVDPALKIHNDFTRNENFLTYTDFVNSLRSKDNPQGIGSRILNGGLATNPTLQDYRSKYQDAIQKGLPSYQSTEAYKQNYTEIQPDKQDSHIGVISTRLEQGIKGRAIRVKNLDGSQLGSLPNMLGYDLTKEADRESMKNLQIFPNTQLGPDGKMTATVHGRDGSGKEVNKVVQLDNVDPNLKAEMLKTILKSGGSANDTGYAKGHLENIYQELGKTGMSDATLNDLEARQPSSTIYSLGDGSDIEYRVKSGGLQGKQYELYVNRNGEHKALNVTVKSPEDLYLAIGRLKAKQ